LFSDPYDGVQYEVDLPAGSELTYNKFDNEVSLYEGNSFGGEYDAFTNDASGMVSIYTSGTHDSEEGCCGPAFILLAALLFSSYRIKN